MKVTHESCSDLRAHSLTWTLCEALIIFLADHEKDKTKYLSSANNLNIIFV